MENLTLSKENNNVRSTKFQNEKKALKEAVKEGQTVRIWQSGPFGGDEPKNGRVSVEGPHAPKPHTWCAGVVVKDGKVIKVT